jgi:hypothetical protein
VIDFPDLTPLELATRKLLTRKSSDFERGYHPETPFRRWARECREDWAARPEGQRAIAQCELKRGKVRHVERSEV